MRVGLMTREYPPYVYGGAGVHVEYLSREMAKTIEVEVHAWGAPPEESKEPTQPSGEGAPSNLEVYFEQPWDAITNGTTAKFKGALEALSLNLLEQLHLEKIDVIHTHTWYVSMAGFLAKKLYGDSVCADDAFAGAVAGVEGGAAGFRLCDELVDGAYGDSGCGCDRRGLEWDEGGYPAGVSGCGCEEDSRDLQRHRPAAISMDAGQDCAGEVWCRPDAALRAVRRAHHATKGRDTPCRRDSVSAAGNAGGALRGGTGHAGDCGGDAGEGGGSACEGGQLRRRLCGSRTW